MSVPDRLSCQEVFRRLDDYLDRALAADELRLVEEHLATCAECASEYRFEESLIDEVRQKADRIQMPSGLLDRILDRLS